LNQNKSLHLCPQCKKIEENLSSAQEIELIIKCGYRKHIIFDLLKDKADLFYKKMLDRKM